MDRMTMDVTMVKRKGLTWHSHSDTSCYPGTTPQSVFIPFHNQISAQHHEASMWLTAVVPPPYNHQWGFYHVSLIWTGGLKSVVQVAFECNGSLYIFIMLVFACLQTWPLLFSSFSPPSGCARVWSGWCHGCVWDDDLWLWSGVCPCFLVFPGN